MARTSLRYIVLGMAATGLLTACVEGAGPVASGDGTTAAAPASRVRAGQEVEAPDVFQANETALWDGRPSLGGTWVASPDAVDPERVVMFNPATGKSVTGALFRRERENPGPRLQLSSDAAEALGVLAGQPVEIRVTALRKQEAPAELVVETPAAPQADAEAAAATAAAATAALDAADAGAKADTEAAEGAVAPDVEVVAGAEEPAPLTWKERRAKAKAEREAKKAAAAAEKAAAAAAETEAAALGAEAVAATAESAGVAAIATAPLDARTPETTKDPAKEPAKAKPEGAEKAAPAVTEPAPSGAARPIQIASFSKEENATRAVQALAKIGITAEVQKSEKSGKVVWSVVASGDTTMLQNIKDAGFADAFFLN